METKKIKKEKKVTKTTEATEPQNKFLIPDSEVDYKTKTILLLDSRNDLVALFFSGLDAMGEQYKPKKGEATSYSDFVKMACRGFIEIIREKSMQIMDSKKPQYGIGDMVKNRKGYVRFIVNMFEEPKTKELVYSWVDPNDSKSPMSICSAKTFYGWAEKN